MKSKFIYLKSKFKEFIKNQNKEIDLPKYDEHEINARQGAFNQAKADAKKAKNSLANIPQDKLFISQSGYAYNIDQIISTLGDKLEPKLFVDFLNPKNKESTVLFTATDIQKLLEFPSLKEAVLRVSSLGFKGDTSNEENFEQLAELASLINEKTLEAMNNIYKTGLPVHAIIKIGNPDKYTQLMSPAMLALKEIIDNMDKTEKIALKLFMDNMPYNYRSARALDNKANTHSLLEVDLLDQLLHEKCGSGFETAMRTLSNTIKAFKNAFPVLATKQELEEQSTNTLNF